MLHYVLLNVSDLKRSASFYDAVLAPLGWRRQEEAPNAIGWGLTKPIFYVTSADSPRPGFGEVSFAARSIPAVKAAFDSGVANGGEPESEPGGPPSMGNSTYAARVYDPDRYLIEICAAPE